MVGGELRDAERQVAGLVRPGHLAHGQPGGGVGRPTFGPEVVAAEHDGRAAPVEERLHSRRVGRREAGDVGGDQHVDVAQVR